MEEISEAVVRLVRREIERALSQRDAMEGKQQPKAIEPAVLGVVDAALYCGLKPRTLYNLKSVGRGPRAYKQGRLTVYRRADLDTWLLARLTEVE